MGSRQRTGILSSFLLLASQPRSRFTQTRQSWSILKILKNTKIAGKYWKLLKFTDKCWKILPSSLLASQPASFSYYPDTSKLLILIISSLCNNLIFTQKSKLVNLTRGVMTIEIFYHLYHYLHNIFPILNNVKHCQCLFSVQRQVLMSSATVYRTTIETEKFFYVIACFWKIPLNSLFARNTGSYIQITQLLFL